MYVTDTHALIWYTQSKSGRLSRRVTSVFEQAEQERTLIYVSSIVLWELADHLAFGTLTLRQRFDHWCRSLDSKPGFQIEPLLWEDVNEARALPFDDPFDCLIAGTALRMGLPLITKDAAITDSGLIETIW